MMKINDTHIISLSATNEGKLFTRYFSGFSLALLDQEVLCYYKKKIVMKRWKDIGSGVEVFLCRKKEKAKIMSAEMLEIVATYGEFLVRNGVVSGIKAHIPLTSKFLGKEDYFTDMVAILRKKGYIVVQTLVQTKDFPLIQRSITDPTLLETLVSSFKGVEKTKDLSIQSIAQVQRREQIVKELSVWCAANGHDTKLVEQYDIALLGCD